ncbi:MAG TPA: TIGR03435 family protein, partial [Bryobacteraceae bacterium]|nr:TIGR03435 family protein [Bryobacteraceae bacterium]
MSPTRHLALTALILSGVAPSCLRAQQTFEVASLKLNNSGTTSMKFPVPFGGRFNGTNLTLRTLISFAWGVQGFQILNAPSWLNSDRYDIMAKAAETNLTLDQYHQMVQALLVDRFRLAVHRETKEVPIYTIAPAKNGGKLEESRPGSCVESGAPSPPPGEPAPVVCGTFFTGPASLDVRRMRMSQIASTLSIVLARPVVDKTGFTGTYDFHIEFSPDGAGLTPGVRPSLEAAPDNAQDDTLPSIFTVLQKQLGLKLESAKGPSEVLVIDHAERIPT